MTLQACRMRLAKIDAVLQAQRRFIYSVPDPDTRERAEHNLYRLIEMRAAALTSCLEYEADCQGELVAA